MPATKRKPKIQKQIYNIDKLPELLMVCEVAALLACKEPLVRKMLRDGRLTGTKIGRQWRIWKSEVLRVAGHPSYQPCEFIAQTA